jgi:alkylation response protein AidB-like acyl-CoA dehydrogenase
MPHAIQTPDDEALDELCARLRQAADRPEVADRWPAEQMQWLADYGVYRWFVPVEFGGFGWSDADQIRGYLRLSSACMTTTFILTQRSGASRRIADTGNPAMQQRWLPDLARGAAFATVGISHLTTSRRHLQRPVLHAEVVDGGYVFDGFSPWVTGSTVADCVVIGATLDDGRQLLAALPTKTAGVVVEPPAQLVALSGSHTGPIRCNQVKVPAEWILAGPVERVMAHGGGGATGGLQTSTLALGLSAAAIDYLEHESLARGELAAPVDALRAELDAAVEKLLGVSLGRVTCSNDELRTEANGLVLRATQAALTAAKGAGYVVGHPAGRWCREALFFLVWSCPQPVQNATLCELAGLE